MPGSRKNKEIDEFYSLDDDIFLTNLKDWRFIESIQRIVDFKINNFLVDPKGIIYGNEIKYISPRGVRANLKQFLERNIESKEIFIDFSIFDFFKKVNF